jgi:hypothetical protein
MVKKKGKKKKTPVTDKKTPRTTLHPIRLWKISRRTSKTKAINNHVMLVYPRIAERKKKQRKRKEKGKGRQT